jgi:hypothetical protein
MSFEPDDTERENDVISQNKEIIALLKAILAGIEIISDQESGSLNQDIE